MAGTSARPLIIDKIVLFGDDQIEQSKSQATGYNIAPALQREYWAKLQIVTHGYHGYNSELGRWIVEAILDAEMPSVGETPKKGTVKLMIVAFGTNDCVSPDNSQQHVPLARYIENIEHIVSKIRARGVKVMLVGPAIVNEIAHNVSLDRSTTRAKEYSQALEKFSKDAGVPILNLWTEFVASSGWKAEDPIPCKRPHKRRRSSSLDPDRSSVARGVMSGARYNRNLSRDEHLASLLADDGVHLSRSGYQLWYQALIKQLRHYWPEMDAKNLTPVFPHISEIDPNDLPRTLWKHDG
jgi:isoamyl acetate esterase